MVAAGAAQILRLRVTSWLAAKSAKFIQSFSKVGLIPDTGGSWHLPHLLGEVRAKGLAFTAEPLSAEKAETGSHLEIGRGCEPNANRTRHG